MDFTPVLRAVRECKQDSAFHLVMFDVGSKSSTLYRPDPAWGSLVDLSVDYTMEDPIIIHAMALRAKTGLSMSGRPP